MNAGGTSVALRHLTILILTVLLFRTPCRADNSPEAADQQEIERLIRNLASVKFKVREQSFEKLKAQPRTIVPLLKPYAESEDPEVRLPVRNLIQYLTTDPGKIPQSFFVFTEKRNPQPDCRTGLNDWQALIQKWAEAGTVCASNLTGNAGGGLDSQSFIPHCDKIAAIEICLYPVGKGKGWLRLDLSEDALNRPSSNILARCWVRMDKDCPVPHSGFMVFAFPDIKVHPEKTYWFQLKSLPDPDCPKEDTSLCNAGFSQNNRYKEGGHLEWVDLGMDQSFDVKFAILSRAIPFPPMKRVIGEELRNLPQPPTDK